MKTKEREKQPSVRKAPVQNRNRTKQEPQRPLQDVVYMPPKPFVRNRLLLHLATVAAVVLALVLAMAVFFKVEYVTVSGVSQYTEWDIKEASGIENGDSLFSLGLPGAAAKIKALPYVKDVRIGIKLPHTVMIEVTEVRVTYAVKAQDESWWLIDSAGHVIEKVKEDAQDSYTKILGVHLRKPKVGQLAQIQETQQPTVDEEGNTIPVTVTDEERFSTALIIADNLEINGILGEAASIDVNDLGNLQVWYGKQYKIKLGDDSRLDYKIEMAKGAIDTLNEKSHNSGVLDASFTVDKTGVRYTRFQ